MEDFVALSIMLMSYSIAELVYGYGFLAVFVAGVTMCQQYHSTQQSEESSSRLEFMERLETLAEVATILLLGSMLRLEPMLRFAVPALLIAGSLLFIIRPLGALISTIRSPVHPSTRWLIGWFGIRGVGSLYYLTYALGSGLKGEVGELISWVTLTTVALSVALHGVTTTPLMQWYERHIEGNNSLEKELPNPD
ncbi:MAG: cation:proton antiporter, partial [Nodosilinea sp.]